MHEPGRLAEEFRTVQLHPTTGERILAPVVPNKAVSARLIAIPDCFDALTTSRACREALPVEQALEVLKEGANRHFDAELVQLFLPLAPRLLEAHTVAEEMFI